MAMIERQVSLTVDVAPQPALRPRVARGIAYTPPAYAEYKLRLETLFCEQLKAAGSPRVPKGCPVALDIVFVMPRPKSAGKKNKTFLGAGRAPHVGRPDTDNLVKAVLDALAACYRDPMTEEFQEAWKKDGAKRVTKSAVKEFWKTAKMGIYYDDAQVYAIRATKSVADFSESPSLYVKLKWWEEKEDGIDGTAA